MSLYIYLYIYRQCTVDPVSTPTASRISHPVLLCTVVHKISAVNEYILGAWLQVVEPPPLKNGSEGHLDHHYWGSISISFNVNMFEMNRRIIIGCILMISVHVIIIFFLAKSPMMELVKIQRPHHFWLVMSFDCWNLTQEGWIKECMLVPLTWTSPFIGNFPMISYVFHGFPACSWDFPTF